MAFVELEDGSWINPAFIEEIYKRNPSDTVWEAGMNHGEPTTQIAFLFSNTRGS